MRWLMAASVVALPGVAWAGCPSTGGCPQPAVNGVQPCDEDLVAIFEAAAVGALGADGPTYLDIGVGNPVNAQVDATMPCVLLKSIGWTESTWLQFCAGSCGGTGPTIISFDCGFGVTQVTSGMSTGSMGAFGFDPQRVASEAAYNVGTGAGILAAKWLVVPSIGDNQPTVVEHWYYSVWAYNGFAYVNNPTNPNFPAGRPPYASPSSLSRGSYPYQELVWGLAQFPPGGRWDPFDLSYPDASAIGSSPGDIPSPATTHVDPCQGGAVVVDDLDPEFTLVEGQSDAGEVSSGWEAHAWTQDPYSVSVPLTSAEWVPELPVDGLYEVDVWLPDVPEAANTAAPFDLSFHGGHAVAMVDQSARIDDWFTLFPGQPLKMLAGSRARVTLTNLAAAPGGLVWDAVRFRLTGGLAGTALPGEACTTTNDCYADNLCRDGSCVNDCVAAGCLSGTCEPPTGICVDGENPADWEEPSQPGDSDGDGIPNGLEGPGDWDGDGVPNFLDPDSDDDGIPDSEEGYDDTDGDSVPDFLDEDSDGDGITDWIEGGEGSGSVPDSDGDGTPDHLDTDSDDDGIPDATEAETPWDPVDSDDDGTPDYADTDSDDDGIPDADEAGDDPTQPVDTDGDCTPDYADTDSDDDGVGDDVESGPGEQPADSDGDGVPDHLDTDSDNDGTPDSQDEDRDGDGVVDLALPGPGSSVESGCGCGGGGGGFGLAGLLALPLTLRRRRP